MASGAPGDILTDEQWERLLPLLPPIRVGIFNYELHPVSGFPGDCLPADAVAPPMPANDEQH